MFNRRETNVQFDLHDRCVTGQDISVDEYITAPVFLYVLLLQDFEKVPRYPIRQSLEMFQQFYVSLSY